LAGTNQQKDTITLRERDNGVKIFLLFGDFFLPSYGNLCRAAWVRQGNSHNWLAP
jgi:hypothetical protein